MINARYSKQRYCWINSLGCRLEHPSNLFYLKLLPSKKIWDNIHINRIMPFLVNFSLWKSLAWASAAVFSPPGQHAKPPSQRLPRCHDESCGMFHRGTHWRTASPSSMPSENASMRRCRESPTEIRNIPSIPRNIQLSKQLNKKGWMLFWSLKQRDVSNEAIRMDNGHSLPCAQSGQTGQAKEKRFKRQRKKYVLSYANVCYCMF